MIKERVSHAQTEQTPSARSLGGGAGRGAAVRALTGSVPSMATVIPIESIPP
jgi:hypothetical protein